LLDFAIHRSQNENTKSKKHSCKNSACSQCGVTWQTDAVGFRKCDLFLFFCYWWGGTKSLGTVATSGLFYKPQMIDEDDCGAIGGMKIGRGN
jgi:hypothetical protein